MKKIKLFTLLSAIVLISITACKKKEDEEEQTIQCDPGYTGANCTTPYNKRFEFTGANEDHCNSSGDISYVCDIIASTSDLYTFTISGLWDEPGAEVTCEVKHNDKNKFTADLQDLGSSGFKIEITSGTLNNAGDKISYTYKIYSGPTLVESCTGTIFK